MFGSDADQVIDIQGKIKSTVLIKENPDIDSRLYLKFDFGFKSAF